MKSFPLRTITWLTIASFSLATLAIFVRFFPQNYPEHTLKITTTISSIIDEITLPMKLAKLSLQEPDAQVLMPVYGASVARTTNTWHAPRGADRQHEGQDIFAPKGTPIFSGTKGFIRRIGVSTLGGNYVFVTGAGGRRYYYAHLDSVAEGLQVGQEVTTDTVLGFVGNTGNAATTPPHLHFGIYERRAALNPLPLLVDRNLQ